MLSPQSCLPFLQACRGQELPDWGLFNTERECSCEQGCTGTGVLVEQGISPEQVGCGPDNCLWWGLYPVDVQQCIPLNSTTSRSGSNSDHQKCPQIWLHILLGVRVPMEPYYTKQRSLKAGRFSLELDWLYFPHPACSVTCSLRAWVFLEV